jgi:hypothetical protein
VLLRWQLQFAQGRCLLLLLVLLLPLLQLLPQLRTLLPVAAVPRHRTQS